MPKFQSFSPEQQTIIDEANAQLRALYQTNPNRPDSKEQQQISKDAAIKLVELMPTGMTFHVTDIEKALPYTRHSDALRRHLNKLVWEDEHSGPRWLSEMDTSRYCWDSMED